MPTSRFEILCVLPFDTRLPSVSIFTQLKVKPSRGSGIVIDPLALQVTGSTMASLGNSSAVENGEVVAFNKLAVAVTIPLSAPLYSQRPSLPACTVAI
ncbi:hypothetical protein D3C72_2036110 [compost metagenome]